MALHTTLEQAGDPILTAYSKTLAKITDGEGVVKTQLTVSKSERWFGMEGNAAWAIIVAAAQPTDGGTYSWSMSVDSALNNSVTIDRTYTKASFV